MVYTLNPIKFRFDSTQSQRTRTRSLKSNSDCLVCLTAELNKFSKEGSLSHTAFRLLLQNLHVSLALAYFAFLPAFLQIFLALT